MVVLLLSILLVAGSYGSLTPTKVPMRYETTQQQSISSTTQTNLHIAHLDCSSLNNAEVVVCAEIVNNWQWDPYMVKFSLISDSNLTAVLNTTDKGPGVPPAHCASVQSWPGGNLHVRVKSGRIVPVDYDITVTVRSSNTPLGADRPAAVTRQQIHAAEAELVGNGVTNILTPVVIYKSSQPMIYPNYLLLEMDVCLDSQASIQTSLISRAGTFIHVLCDGPCQGFDDKNVIMSYPCNTAYPVCSLSAKLPSALTTVYALVQAASGVKDPSANDYVAEMNFSATFSS